MFDAIGKWYLSHPGGFRDIAGSGNREPGRVSRAMYDRGMNFGLYIISRYWKCVGASIAKHATLF